ncbi:MLV-related proviral Env polyprotein-like [Grus japonensis]|uniref:MLV-related proviral Env polyprotein-like n=1 Tax=Grus japonensis TaxID=30415 RepID=A0ABC9WW89_GRUJA
MEALVKDRIIGHRRNPYTPVTREGDKLASVLSKPGSSALAEAKQRQNSLCRGGLRCLCVVLILELVTIGQDTSARWWSADDSSYNRLLNNDRRANDAKIDRSICVGFHTYTLQI